MPAPIIAAYGIWQTYMGAFGSIKNITRALQATAFPKDPYAAVTLGILDALKSGKLVFENLKPETQNSIIELLKRYLTLPIGQTGSSTPLGQATQQLTQQTGSQLTQQTSNGCLVKETFQQSTIPQRPSHILGGKECPAGYIWSEFAGKCIIIPKTK